MLLDASAGTFSAVPVRMTIAGGATSAALMLRNDGNDPVLVQAEVMAWTQKDGVDVLEPSRDLVVSPPIFKVAPGAQQTVRIGLMRAPDSVREITYRVFLQEVPQPTLPGEVGVSMLLRLGLPVFVMPKGGAAPRMAWRATRGADGQIKLTLTNTGTAHVQPIDGKLYLEDGTLIAAQNLPGYVLPDQTRSWQIKPTRPWSAGKLRLTARTDAGEIAAEFAPD